MIKGIEWQPLKSGDKVYIIAPAAKTDSAEADLMQICNFLKSWELEPIYSKNIFGQGPNYYHYANSHQARAANFIEAAESDAAAILIFRGGYGSDWITAALFNTAIAVPVKTKVLVGFSDVTYLHNFIQQQWGWCSIHGPSLRQLALQQIDPVDIQCLKDLLFGHQAQMQFSLHPLNNAAKQNQNIETSVVGGNLATIQSCLKTPWELNMAARTVLFEDIDEQPYRVARMLHQLHSAGCFAQVHALLFGDFNANPQQNTSQQFQDKIDAVLQEFAVNLPMPVLRIHGVGHGNKNLPVPLNTGTQLILGAVTKMIVAAGSKQMHTDAKSKPVANNQVVL